MTKEETLQKSVASYLRLQHPKVLWCHIANERQTSPQRGAKLKAMGVKKGMPDIMVFDVKASRGKSSNSLKIQFVGLAIELKIKPNKPSKEQLDVLSQLRKKGWKAEVCYSFDEAQKIIDNYFS